MAEHVDHASHVPLQSFGQVSVLQGLMVTVAFSKEQACPPCKGLDRTENSRKAAPPRHDVEHSLQLLQTPMQSTGHK